MFVPFSIQTATRFVAASLVALCPAMVIGAEALSAASAESSPVADVEMSRWSRPSDADIQQRLDDLEYQVTQKEGTERPFQNRYWDNHADGIYVDVVSGEPLFSSRQKFESGTGWPSFTAPLEPALIVERNDRRFGMARTEVRSRVADSHLGHVFDDGPGPGGLRYCINSAALRFIPVADLEREGYGEYRALFE